MFDIQEELKKLPGKPGVYLMHDETDKIIYVGKAINSAYQNPGLPFDLGIRQNLVKHLKEAVEGMGKKVTVTYY